MPPPTCITPPSQSQYNATRLVNLRMLPAARDISASSFAAVFGIERTMGGYNNTYEYPE